MSAQFYAPGPAQIFVGTGGSAAYEFLGWSDVGVDISIASSFEDVNADFGGPAVPVDVQWMGEQAYVSATLTRYDEAVLNKCLARLLGGTPGAAAANAVGSLMISEGYAYPVAVVSPYASKTFQSAAVNPAYTFSQAWLHDNQDRTVGLRAIRPRVIFRAIPLWTPSTLTNVLYTLTKPSSLPAAS